jgi:hypothetical protein
MKDRTEKEAAREKAQRAARARNGNQAPTGGAQ